MKDITFNHNENNPPERIVQKPVKYMIYSREQAFRHITQTRSKDEQALYLITDDILFHVWDALCLSIDQKCREEYLPFLPHVFDLLNATQDGQDLFGYLVFIEENKMGALKGDTLARKRARLVVEILLDYKQSIIGDKPF